MKTVGFIIDSVIPDMVSVLHGKCGPLSIFRGAMTNGSVAIMRFGWVADEIANHESDVTYELYKSWKRYDAVVFQKSMGRACERLLDKLSTLGTKTIFDANVDYFSKPIGKEYYKGMMPRVDQIESARYMAGRCDGVIGDSAHITGIASKYNQNCSCITDNVRNDLILNRTSWSPSGGKITLLWSGEAVKLFDILSIKEVLINSRHLIRLRIITNSLEGTKLWDHGIQQEFKELLAAVEHEILPFTTVEDLMKVYDKGGVFISPRFLDNNYNYGHTEWKITLAMARGCVVLCSPQPSYMDVANLAGMTGIKICRTQADWESAIEAVAGNAFDWKKEQNAACCVVKEHYSTAVVAKRHLSFVENILAV